ncbi:MAG: Coenzyme F420 hydrogenase/dehydrogenase, beta subunit C-terminal domain [Phascolarctobacterium sp.]
MIELHDKADCTGCSACANICPRGCITMKADNEGFLYPKVNTDMCVDCGLCEEVCPMLSKPVPHDIKGVYGAKNKDDSVRFTSSSGGMFTVFAEEVIRNGGVVFGAALDDNHIVKHIMVDSIEALEKLRGSKYVQSIIADTYAKVRALLRSGKKVLFSGTPCQIAGLKKYLIKPFDNLITIDLVCHGVPSPMVYKKHLAELSSKAGEPITCVKFRDKSNGWKQGETLFFTEHHKMGAPKRQEPYMRLFLNNVIIRPSCGQCAFNNKRSQADITIADYWGIDKQFPEFDDDKGVTLVIVNTDRGASLFESIKDNASVLATDYEKGAEFNWAVVKSLPLHKKREYFFKNIEKYSINELVELCLEK